MNRISKTISPSEMSFRPTGLVLRCLRAGARPRVSHSYHGLYPEQSLTIRSFFLLTNILCEAIAIWIGYDNGTVDITLPISMLIGELALASCAEWMNINMAEMEQQALIADEKAPATSATIRAGKSSFRWRKYACILGLFALLIIKTWWVFHNAEIAAFNSIDLPRTTVEAYESAIWMTILYAISFLIHLFNSGILVLGALGSFLFQWQFGRYNSSGRKAYSDRFKPKHIPLSTSIVEVPADEHWLRADRGNTSYYLEINSSILSDRQVREFMAYQPQLDANGRTAIEMVARNVQLNNN